MKRKAIQFYRQGYNCATCVLKAAQYQYGIVIPQKMIQGCGAVNSGFGIGGMCGVLIIGVMIFGMLFDEKKAKEMRLKLFSRFHEKHSSFNCASLSVNNDNCESIISDVCDLVEEIVREG